MMRFTLLALLLAAAGCNDAGAAPPNPAERPAPPSAKSVRVETAELKPSLPELTITLPGEIEGHRDALVQASPGGLIESVHVKVGDKVRRGQLMVRVDAATQSALLNQANVEVDAAEREYRRARGLQDVLPGAELDAADSRWRSAVAAAKAQRVAVSRSTVTAPFSGVVVRVDAEAGEVAGPGVPLVRVVQLDPVKVVVSLADRDVVAIKEGMTASVRVGALPEPFEGTVKRIHRAADMSTRAFTAEIEIPNPDKKLLPGMIASVSLVAQLEGKGMVISLDWLVTGRHENGVFLNENGVARWRPLTLGPILREQVLVTKGLKAGDDIVITGHRDLAEGDPLLINRHGWCCENGRAKFD